MIIAFSEKCCLWAGCFVFNYGDNYQQILSKNWGGTKFTNELAWLRLFETIEAVKLTFYIGLQNGFDVNCLTLGLRLYLMTVNY